MINISGLVGKNIKFYRNKRNMNLEQLSKVINKSISTLSKYENGEIIIDIQTLYEISLALDVDITNLLNDSAIKKPLKIPQNVYWNRPEMYMYFYDGHVRGLVKSLLTINFSEKTDTITVVLYIGITEKEDWQKCEHIYKGVMKPYDMLTHFILENQVKEAEMVYINILNPFKQESPSLGIITAVNSNPIAPISTKVIISKTKLVDTAALKEQLLFSKEDIKDLRYYNMLITPLKNFKI